MGRVAGSVGLLVLAALTAAGCGGKSKQRVESSTSAGVSSGVARTTSASTGGGLGLRSPLGTTLGPVTATPGGAATPAPAPTTGVGSRFWYENDTFGQPLKRNDAAQSALAAELLALHNQERARMGLRPLAMDAEAEQAGKAHAEDMLGRRFFDHLTPEGWNPDDRLKLLGAKGYVGWGENIILGYPTAQEMHTAWMNSPGHRANILSPQFTHVGFGLTAQGPYAAAVFLTR